MTGAPCGVLAPAVEVNDDGAPTGFSRGRCACGWVSEAARALFGEAEADAGAHRRQSAAAAAEPPGLAGALAHWDDATEGAQLEADPALNAAFSYAAGHSRAHLAAELAGRPELAALAELGRAWIVTAYEHERRAEAYRSGGDTLTAELRRRLDAAWDLLAATEAAGRRVIRPPDLRDALQGVIRTPGRPVTGGGPVTGNTTEGNGTDGKQTR